MLAALSQTATQFIQAVKLHYPIFATWLGLLWGIQLINMCLGRRLCWLGIHPRAPLGLPGIVLSPFIHVDFGHLLMNSVGLLVLGNLLVVQGIAHVFNIAIFASLIGGGLVWLFGRNMIHVGASGLVMGLAGALCIVAYEQSTIYAWLLAGLLFYFFEHLAINLVPGEPGTSWEGHLCGFIGGALAEHFHWDVGSFFVA